MYGVNCSVSASNLTATLDRYVNECFPLKKHKVRARDPPWINADVRWRQRRKRRKYNREGRSPNYYAQRRELDEIIANNKVYFMAKVKDKARSSGNRSGYYQAAKSLSSKETPVHWCISMLYPHLSSAEIAEIVATFFSKISDEIYPASSTLT